MLLVDGKDSSDKTKASSSLLSLWKILSRAGTQGTSCGVEDQHCVDRLLPFEPFIRMTAVCAGAPCTTRSSSTVATKTNSNQSSKTRRGLSFPRMRRGRQRRHPARPTRLRAVLVDVKEKGHWCFTDDPLRSVKVRRHRARCDAQSPPSNASSQKVTAPVACRERRQVGVPAACVIRQRFLVADAARVVLCVHLDARTLVRQARRHRAASPCVSAALTLRVSVVERLLVLRAQPLEYKTQWSTVRLTLPAPVRADRLVSLQPFVGFHRTTCGAASVLCTSSLPPPCSAQRT